MFRQEDIDRLLEQLNIVDVVGEFVELKNPERTTKDFALFMPITIPLFSQSTKEYL